MGFSSSRLEGAARLAIPSVSYAYAPTNTQSFGIPAHFDPGEQMVGGLVTPYLVFPTASPKVSCTPFEMRAQATLQCPVANTALTPGLYTISFSQFSSTTDSAQQTFVQVGTVEQLAGFDVTFSVTGSTDVPTSTVTVDTTLTSGTLDVTPTTTIVPSSVVTVTVYQSTVVVAQVSTSTLTGALTSTVGVCPTSKPMVCNRDNCLRGMLLRSSTASAFCATYTIPPSIPSAFANACQSNPSRLSSACARIPTQAPARRGVSGLDDCLQALLGHATDAAAFCATYTKPPPSVLASSCQSNPTRLSSACSCLMTSSPVSIPKGPLKKVVGVNARGAVIVPTTTAKPMVCNHDNCLRAMLRRPDTAGSFCSSLSQNLPESTPFANDCQSNPSRLSSACACVATAAPAPAGLIGDRGAVVIQYGPPDITYGSIPTTTITVTDTTVPATTVVVDPATVTSGTVTVTSSVPQSTSTSTTVTTKDARSVVTTVTSTGSQYCVASVTP